MFCRFIKPIWGIKFLEDKKKNPDFVKEIKGPRVVEGYFKSDYIEKMNNKGYNVYWFPNHPSKNIYSKEKMFLSGRDIDTFNYLFIDMDLKDGVYKSKREFYEELESFELLPTLTIDSGNGVHAYWEISDLDRASFVFGQLSLINRFKTDESVWTVLQLMRIPESYNTKDPDNKKLAKVIDKLSSDKVYSLEDFPNEFFDISSELEEKAQRHLDKLDGKITLEIGSDLNLEELPDKFLDLLYEDDNISDLFKNPRSAYNNGDRSVADWKLCNILYKKDFNAKELLAIISNTEKALEKGSSRLDYALSTVDKVISTRTKKVFKSAGAKLREGFKSDLEGSRIKGPYYFEQLEEGWRKKQVLGLIGGSGVGKTNVTLNIFKHFIENNPERDDIFVFFSLEMPEQEIIEEWIHLVGEDPEKSDRLFVIGNEGFDEQITLQDIIWSCQDLKKQTGREIGSIAIDHMGIVNPLVNVTKTPTFGARGVHDSGRGKFRALPLPEVYKQTKSIAKMLDTFVIALTQTTKGKGSGDTPIEKDGAYGAAQFEWMMDFIITIWQPIKKAYDKTDLRVTAWQYAKIRRKRKDDRILEGQKKLLTFIPETSELRPTTPDEKAEFDRVKPMVDQMMKDEQKNKGAAYGLTHDKAKLKLIKERRSNGKV